MKADEKNERPVAYPKPTETDTQMKTQDEYASRQPTTHDTEAAPDTTINDMADKKKKQDIPDML